MNRIADISLKLIFALYLLNLSNSLSISRKGKLNWHTESYTTDTTTTAATTTALPGCFYRGVYLKPGQLMQTGFDRQSNWCYGVICQPGGMVEHWDDFHCIKTTPSTTTPVTTTPVFPTTPNGCVYEGRILRVLESIETGYDPASHWCSGVHCDAPGQLLFWDDFRCRMTTQTTQTTTEAATTTPQTTTAAYRHFIRYLVQMIKRFLEAGLTPG